MGGDRVVAAVAGQSAENAVGDEVRRLHDAYFRAGAAHDHARSTARPSWSTRSSSAATGWCWPARPRPDLVDELLDIVGSGTASTRS